MLRVKTYLDKSKTPGAGIGLFAGEDIPKGAVIWQLDEHFDRVIDATSWPPDVPKDFLACYAYSPSGDGLLHVCLDNARFMNHSRTPNGTGGGAGKTVAVRDIKAGEELTEDYRVFYDPEQIKAMDFI